jgi:hypothetical protein
MNTQYLLIELDSDIEQLTTEEIRLEASVSEEIV